MSAATHDLRGALHTIGLYVAKLGVLENPEDRNKLIHHIFVHLDDAKVLITEIENGEKNYAHSPAR